MQPRDVVRTIILGSVFGAALFGATAVIAWTGPGSNTPPNCPTSIQGCNVPINTGSTAQTKTGTLTATDFYDTTYGVWLSTAVNPASRFGGFYEFGSVTGCNANNPITGTCGCPSWAPYLWSTVGGSYEPMTYSGGWVMFYYCY